MKIAATADGCLTGEAIQHFNCSTDMKTTGCPFVVSCWYHLLCCLVLIFGNYGSECKGQSPYRPFDPGYPSNPYGLTDLDHFSDAYDYCKWGNLLDSSVVNSTTLKFSWLTEYDAASAPPAVITDLFVSDSSTTLNIVDLSSLTSVSWVAPLGPFTSGRLNLSHQIGNPASFPTYLFRRLHFKNSLTDEVTNTTLGSDTSKVIVLIHGWNRTSDPTPYGEGNIEFPGLKTNLKAKLSNSGWKLVCYDWAADADTGGLLEFPESPTKAGEIAHQHGQHLGELLANIAPNGSLQKVHFIAHSAGTWAARAAARYLTTNTYAKVQITLLDPFMPARLPFNDTALKESEINQMPLMDGNNSGQLVLLENYFAIDDLNPSITDFIADTDSLSYATSAVFTGWRVKDMNLQVDWVDGSNAYYRSHAGPIQFYADTVWDPNLQVTASLQKQVFKGLTVGIGWKRSMFYQEPQITPQPSFSASIYSPGASPTLSSGARKRGENVTTGISFQWQILSGGTWTDIPSATSQNYTVSSVTTAMDGRQYRLVVSNDAGTDVSNSVTLHVGTSGGTVPIRPTGLTATAVSSNQINLAWNDNSNNESGFIIQRKTGANGTYAAIATTPSPLSANTSAYFDTGLLQGAAYSYQVIAAGSPNSDPSNEAVAATPSNTGSVRILTLRSVNPASGVHLILGPNDINGLADGNTAFSRQYTSSVTATVIAPATWNGNAFQKWQRDGQDWTTSTVANVFMDSSHTMTAIYAASTQCGTSYNIAVTAAPANGGILTGTGTFASNTTASIQATAAPGYTFLNWTVNTSGANGGTTFAVQPQVSFPATANLSLVANFTQDINHNYNVTTNAEPTDSGDVTGAGSYPPASNVPLRANAKPGYVFDYWTENGVVISFISTYAFPQIDKAHNFVAHFHQPAPGAAPDLIPRIDSSTRYAFAGGSGNITAAVKNRGSASSNPFWASFRISDAGSSNAPPEFTNNFYVPAWVPAIPIGIEAGIGPYFSFPNTLAPGEYDLWMVVDPEEADGEPSANRADNSVKVPLTILPPPAANGPDLFAHDFSVTPSLIGVGGSIQVQGGVRNVGNVSGNGGKAYVSISTSPTVPPDKNSLGAMTTIGTLGIYVDAGIASVISLPNTLGAGNYYIWIIVDPENTSGQPPENRSNDNYVLPLTIYQEAPSYQITATSLPPTLGSVTGGGVYSEGALVPLFASAAPGYDFVNWTENGLPVSTATVYSFIAGSPRTITANFAGPCTLSLSSPHGSVSRNPDQPSYALGNMVSLNAVPDYGYQFMGWSGDAASTVNPLSVTMNATKSITANFTPILFTLKTKGSNGTVLRSSNQDNYAAGSTVTLTAQPSDGYLFSGWGGDTTGSMNPITLTFDSSKTVVATFTSGFDQQMNFNNDTLPSNWVIRLEPNSPGSNAHVQNSRFEVGGQDTYAYIESNKHVPANATEIQIAYTGNINNSGYGMYTSAVVVMTNGDKYSANFGNSDYGSRMRAHFGTDSTHFIDQYFPIDFQPFVPYRFVTTIRDGKVSYKGTRLDSSTSLFDQTVDVPGFAIHDIQSLRFGALDTSSFAPSWVDDVSVRATSAYQQWKELYFGSGYSINVLADDEADPNRNGLPNILEYALGADPNVNDSMFLPIPFMESGINPGPSFRYRRRTGSNRLNYTVGVSNDLLSWDWSQGQVEQIGVPLPIGDGQIENVTVRVPAGLPNGGRIFFKLKVNEIP